VRRGIVRFRISGSAFSHPVVLVTQIQCMTRRSPQSSGIAQKRGSAHGISAAE
jgi:hypothetical protein